jgi:hypothetical protein
MFRSMSRTITTICAAVGAAVLISANAFATHPFDCASGNGKDRGPLRVVGLTQDGNLVCFSENAPHRARDIGYVSGLTGNDTTLVGIDFRVQDGFLYGVGNGGGIYRLDTTNAFATLVSQLTVALDGNSFGVDFNPAADRLRIVSDTGQNLRHNINAAGTTLVDGVLNAATTPALGIVGAAYTNNDVEAANPVTATTLFDLDAMLDQIVIQSPPNNGSLVATGTLTVDAGAAAGFDIYSHLRRGLAVANSGFAVLNVTDSSRFFRINLLTGKGTYAGSFRDSVVDIAVPLNR